MNKKSCIRPHKTVNFKSDCMMVLTLLWNIQRATSPRKSSQLYVQCTFTPFFYYFSATFGDFFFSWMIFLVHIRFLFFFSSQMDDMGRCQILGSHFTLVALFISKCVGNFLNQSDWQNIFFSLWERFSLPI